MQRPSLTEESMKGMALDEISVDGNGIQRRREGDECVQRRGRVAAAEVQRRGEAADGGGHSGQNVDDGGGRSGQNVAVEVQR